LDIALQDCSELALHILVPGDEALEFEKLSTREQSM
jgi:hypothetical protein